MLDYEPEQPRTVEPLIGWTSSADMKQEVHLVFDTAEEAVAYCERHGIPYQVFKSKPPVRQRISYADNFTFRAARRGRTKAWSPKTGASEAGAARPRRASGDLLCAEAGIGATRGGKLPALRGGALAQQRDETLLRHRLTEQESLTVVAAHADQGERVRCLLDPNRQGQPAEIVRKVDDGLAQRRIDLVGAAIGDERPVELEFGKRQFLEPDQGGIPRPKSSIASLTSRCRRLLVISAASARSVTICSSVTSMIRPGHFSNCGR